MENAMLNISRACRCYAACAKKMHSAKRLFRIINGLGYKAASEVSGLEDGAGGRLPHLSRQSGAAPDRIFKSCRATAVGGYQ